MNGPAFLTGVFLLFPNALAADPLHCTAANCRQDFQLASVSDTKSYGILLAAPDFGCRRVRYRVETAASDFLGHTPALAPGEIALVRMGRGFAKGAHALTIAAEGCAAAPALARRVTLVKLSPDHGARAAAQGF